MGLESIFSKSWGEFKKNITLSLKISWWTFILPCLIILLIVSVIVGALLINFNLTNIANMASALNNSATKPSLSNFTSITGRAIGSSMGSVIAGVIIFFVLFFLVMTVIILIFQLAVLYASVYNEKGGMGAGQAVRGGLKYFWKFVGFGLLVILIDLGIFLGLLILGILLYFLLKGVIALFIFLVVLLFILFFCLIYYLNIGWFFSIFIITRENIGIVEAMRRSSVIVKGRWWKTFAYILLFGLIVTAISFAISMVIQLFMLMFFWGIMLALFMGGIAVALVIFFVGGVLAAIYGLMLGVIILAFFLLAKNMYLEFRQERVKK